MRHSSLAPPSGRHIPQAQLVSRLAGSGPRRGVRRGEVCVAGKLPATGAGSNARGSSASLALQPLPAHLASTGPSTPTSADGSQPLETGPSREHRVQQVALKLEALAEPVLRCWRLG